MEKLTYQANQDKNTPKVEGFDWDALEKLKVECYNAETGTLTGYDCPKCKNRGRFAWIDPTGHLSFYRCQCMNIRNSLAAMERSGLSKLITKMHFSTFRCDTPWQKTMLEKARDYAKDANGWFLACGQPGSGKTHLCTAICRELLYRGLKLQYKTWRELVDQVLKDRTNAMDKLKQVDVLYIDDLFKMTGEVPDFMKSIAFELFNARYVDDRITIVSTELSPQALINVDEAIGSRILEKAGAHILMVDKDPGKNYRMRSVCRV